ncbi:hypothetical protein GLOTRDRAFT_141019 [Gloeophyllum trabeum ATCC 11539]|uniref:Uncharacterized protein n=1 Tax=Gloeophyllum trabeum (strain ATCC 11539 / FP-39264 / Madison 617) TaxID=670483 RepID=S7PWF8_GLOTA|nr:uncharacterized protein GLOTRDRAFT_141019 [Gloeophyllum trabeum ATCC 11539]EPQ51667.1 hypothetical protein GLOTRDRAFT_141019 [Gloeophyllum trabeum ATCC 11539]
MSTNETPGSSAGASLGNKIKSAFTTAHGAGESIRGNAMDALDAAFGTRKPENVAATRQGEAEVQQGVANMDQKYGNEYAGTTTEPAGNPPVGTTGARAAGVTENQNRPVGSGAGTAGTL